MPVPKKKTSRSRRDRRRAHHDRIKPLHLAFCKRCGEPKIPHRACKGCGYYGELQIWEEKIKKKK
jgi:large subunit ribosomal protein L32